MATFRLSRSLMGIFALSCLSMSASIVGFSTFIAPHTSMAQGFVPAVATACVRPSPPVNKEPIQNVTGTLQSISGQTLLIVNAKKTPPSISATYSSTTDITQETSVTTAVLKPGTDVFIQALPNANNTAYTAKRITLRQGEQPNDIGCFPDDKPDRLSTPPAGGTQPHNGDCIPGQAPSSATSTCRLRGTVQQLTGTTLTIKNDRQAKNYTIILTNTTKLIQDVPATSTALKANTLITVIGPSTNGVITALRITISDKALGTTED